MIKFSLLLISKFIPKKIILPLCYYTNNDALMLIEDLDFLGVDSYIIEENYILNNGIPENIESIFMLAGISQIIVFYQIVYNKFF